MSSEGTLVARGVWKRFRPDRRRGAAVLDQIERLRAGRRGERRPWQWALRDVDLHVAPGESVGLFGSNGSGKSTLLKLLTRVMYPYAGSVEAAGRVGALIEIRAGIHPDLTARENIAVLGTLMGLPRKEVARRFDDIVAFAGIESAIDRQMKFFSSGMQMRLGFSVATALEPAILLVDEVLAVGDASFQQRCLDRMRALLSDGTTLVLVSHDLAAVEAMCKRGVWLRDGRVAADGEIHDALGAYRNEVESQAEEIGRVHGAIRLGDIRLHGGDGDLVRSGGPLDVDLVLEAEHAWPGVVHVGVSEGTASPVFVLRHEVQLGAGATDVRCRIARLPLPRGTFYVWVGVSSPRGTNLLPWQPIGRVEVSGPELDSAPPAVVRLAPVLVEASWDSAGADQ